jgi:hypothetical protein
MKRLLPIALALLSTLSLSGCIIRDHRHDGDRYDHDGGRHDGPDRHCDDRDRRCDDDHSRH